MAAVEALGKRGVHHNSIAFGFQPGQSGAVDFRGYKYDHSAREGPDNPDVVTLSMSWVVNAPNGNIVRYSKAKGGFFVGLSIEGLFAMGTVSWFQYKKNLLRNDKIETEINGGVYDIVMHPNTPSGANANPDNVDYIRTFFPILKRGGGIDNGGGGGDNGGNGAEGSVVIERAMVNPSGEEIGREWVRIYNKSMDLINLEGWNLRDGADRSHALDGYLDPKSSRTFFTRTRDPNSMMLRNRSGIIRLFHGREEIDEVTYGKTRNDEVVIFFDRQY